MRLQITYRDFGSSDAIDESVRDEAAMLRQLSDRLLGCHVILSSPQGGAYRIQVDLTLPGETIVVMKESGHGLAHDSFYSTLHDAFRAARDRVAQLVEREREHRHDLHI